MSLCEVKMQTVAVLPFPVVLVGTEVSVWMLLRVVGSVFTVPCFSSPSFLLPFP